MADAERERRDSRDRYDDDDDADDIKYDILIPQHEIILKQGYAGPSASPVNGMLIVPRERRYGAILFSNHSVAPLLGGTPSPRTAVSRVWRELRCCQGPYIRPCSA